MIPAGPATRVFVALEPVDMRKGYDGLYCLVTHQLGEDPRSGHLFVFTNSQRNRLKIFYWDGSGLWVCGKRLEKGRFSWPAPQDSERGKVCLSAAALGMLLGGIDLGRASPELRDLKPVADLTPAAWLLARPAPAQ